jgi:hypothetical protein
MKKLYFLPFLFFCAWANAQTVDIPDDKFRVKLLTSNNTNNLIAQNINNDYIAVDADGDGEIQLTEAEMVCSLHIPESDIDDLTGIEAFTTLKWLECGNNNITTLDLTSSVHLEGLYCYVNQLTSLNVAGLHDLQVIYCGTNQLTALDLTGLDSLYFLSCGYNLISSLDFSELPPLQNLHCDHNLLSSLDINEMTGLIAVICNDNNLSSLDLSGLNLGLLVCSNNHLTSLETPGFSLHGLRCDGNLLTTLDLSDKPEFDNLDCHDNLLQTLFLKNGSTETDLNFSGNPNLTYICADGDGISEIQTKIIQYELTNCHVNSYCTFVPGGTYYTIEGNTRIDTDNDGCEASDPPYPFLRCDMATANLSGSIYSNSTGSYSISVQEGSHTMTPVLENPAYFSVAPESMTVSFPADASPDTLDFCITANGAFPDLEIVIFPLTQIRPGLDGQYCIIYKNKGSVQQSGTVTLAFEGDRMDFVSSNPATASQTDNLLSWNFTDLAPFAQRQIEFTLNANSPTEIPPLFAGYQLNFAATVNPVTGDETPQDNVFGFKQTVVNAVDPNDKTCLEGDVVTPEIVGQYVHYLIRFENTGTADALNIVVKDIIDATKFDMASLIPLSGSHPFATRVSEANKVEFIFENTNLPFDDNNNDGYVLFKIKTLPSLVVGDAFANDASIYFDYNFPVVTNTATTLIQLLGAPDFDFSDVFVLYPNPVRNTLNLQLKRIITVQNINIYNALGQLVLAVPDTENVFSIDVSSLKTGNYFIKVNSDKGMAASQFIKE